MRHLDGMMSASVVSAMCCLDQALVLKAIEISKYGLLNIEDEDWYDQTYRIKERMLNNCPEGFGENRLSNTCLTSEDIRILKIEAYDLITQLKHFLLRTGPSFDVLEKLLEKPVAYLRCEGKTWEEVEKYYALERSEETIIEHKLFSLIDFRTVLNCKSEDDWLEKAAKHVSAEICTPQQLIATYNNLRRSGFCTWSVPLGTVLKV